MSHPDIGAHDMLRYGTSCELASVAVPFLREGLDAGEAAIVVCAPANAALVTAGLDHDDRVLVLDRSEVYQRPAIAITAYTRAVRRLIAAGAARVRLLGEIAFGCDRESCVEWLRFEAVASWALRPLPVWGVCAYNVAVLPAWILDDVEAAHPTLLSAAGRIANDGYIEPEVYLRATDTAPIDPIEAEDPLLRVEAVTGVAQLRHDLQEALALSGHTGASVDALVMAANEVATNAILHGGLPVRVRLWSTPRRSVCVVTDHGDGFDDPFVGYLDTDVGASNGRGLWLARQLCDRVHIGRERAGGGFTVRLHVRH